jgi:hypothetical protein
MKNSLLPILILSAFIIGMAAAPAAASPDTVYTWIDENGVINYTNTLPPEGAVIIDTEKELPHDAQQARQRARQQERYLEQLRREAQENRTEAQPEVPVSRDAASEDRAETETETVQNDRNRRDETWHQDRIERRQKKKLDQALPQPTH